MMIQGQLDQPQRPPFIPTPVPIEHMRVTVGMLGNEFIQVPARIVDPDNLIIVYRQLLPSVQPAFKLALLKRQKFTPQGREERIKASLAAVNAAQPIELTLAQWKEIVEEVEDEE